jgi:hypothetical protein
MSTETSDHPKRPWPLIWAGIVLGLLAAATVAACVAMYIANFNLLSWME